MKGCRYPIALKVEAIRRVICDGRSVRDVADELTVSEGSLFFWLRRYREFASRQRVAGAIVGRLDAASLNATAIISRRSNAVDKPFGHAGSLATYLRNQRR